MRTLLYRILLLMLIFLPGSRQEGFAAAVQQGSKESALFIDTNDSHHQQAILTDNRNSYRLCSNRPQRLIPTSGAKHERTSGKLSAVGFVRQSTTLKPPYGGVVCSESAPLGFVASRDYYVFALRHIIR